MPSSNLSDNSYQSMGSEYENDVMMVPPVFQEMFEGMVEETPINSSSKNRTNGSAKDTKSKKAGSIQKMIRNSLTPNIKDILYKPPSKKVTKVKSDSRVKKTVSREELDRKLIKKTIKSKESNSRTNSSGSDSSSKSGSSNASKTPITSRQSSEAVVKSEKKKSNDIPLKVEPISTKPDEEVTKPQPIKKTVSTTKNNLPNGNIQNTSSNATINTKEAKLTMDLLFDPIKRKDPSEFIEENQEKEEIPTIDLENPGQNENEEEGNSESGSEGTTIVQDDTQTQNEVEIKPDETTGVDEPTETKVEEEQQETKEQDIQVPERSISQKIDTIMDQRGESSKKASPIQSQSSSKVSQTSERTKSSSTITSKTNEKNKKPKETKHFPKLKTKEEKNEEEKQQLKKEYEKFNPLSYLEEEELNEQEKKKLMAKKRELKWFLYQMQNSGIPVSREYTYEDDLEEMKFEAKKLKDQWDLKQTSRSTWTIFMTANNVIQKILENIDPEETEWTKWCTMVESNRKEYMMLIRSIHRKKLAFYRSNPKARFFYTFGSQAAYFFGPIVISKLFRWGKKPTEIVPPVQKSAPEVSSHVLNEKMEKKMEDLENNILNRVQSIQNDTIEQQKASNKQFEELSKMFKLFMMSQQQRSQKTEPTSNNQSSKSTFDPSNKDSIWKQTVSVSSEPAEGPSKPVEYVTTVTHSTIPPKIYDKNVAVTMPKELFSSVVSKKPQQTQEESNIKEIIEDTQSTEQGTVITLNPMNENENQDSESEIEFVIAESPKKQNSPPKSPLSTKSEMKVPSMESLLNRPTTTAPTIVTTTTTQPTLQQTANNANMINNIFRVDPNCTIESPQIKLLTNSMSTFVNPVLSHIRDSKQTKRNTIPDDMKVFNSEHPPTPPDSDDESDETVTLH